MSGKEAKVTSTVLYPQLWPHSYLSLTYAQREIKFEDLTLEELVAGFGKILQSRDIPEIESSARLKHLVSLMYFAKQYEWHAVLSFHGAVLLEIERGLLQWGDSFFHLESRTLYGHPKSGKNPATIVPNASVLFCRYFQHKKCSPRDHHGCLETSDPRNLPYGIWITYFSEPVHHKYHAGMTLISLLATLPVDVQLSNHK